MEAHGTGTPLGDPIEVEALSKAFRLSTSRSQFCALGSLKGNIGHLEAAAGIVGLVKVALSLWHRELVPTINVDTPNPRIRFAESGLVEIEQQIQRNLQFVTAAKPG